MNCKVSELIEAQKDYIRWKKHVEEKKKIKFDPDIFSFFEASKKGAKSLLKDFSDEPKDSVVTIFETKNDNFKIDIISNKDEFELHSEEYSGEDVIAIVFFKDGEPFVKKMKSQV